ncbi:MAG TPA: phage holin family protein [Verrucomicrobiota bacterium]|nr:phage holin family protein [Verrucomicrobiota bacterium]
MDESEHPTTGWGQGLRRAADSLLGLVQSRFELFTLECQEEKLRALNLIVWLAVALTLGAAGLLVGLGALALWLWHVAGYLGLVGLMLAALAAGGALLWALRRRIQTGPAPFADTLAEFRKDRECLRDGP